MQFRGGNHDIPHSVRSHKEDKKNNHHHLSIKMRENDSFKSYISFFQTHLTKVPNCGEDIFELAFSSGMQVSHPEYK